MKTAKKSTKFSSKRLPTANSGASVEYQTRHMEILELLIGLETKLHSYNVRSSIEKLKLLLSDEYMEIGASGKIYNKKETIDLLVSSKPYEIAATDFTLNQLSSELMQLIYRANDNANSKTGRKTIRNSLWKKNGDDWQMLFHQGTIEH